MNSQTSSVSAHWDHDFDESQIEGWAEQLRKQIVDENISLGLLFLTPVFFEHAEKVMEIIRVYARVPLLMGCTSHGIISNGEEIEQRGGFSLSLFHLPGAELDAMALSADQVNEVEDGNSLSQVTGITRDDTNGWLLLADPFHLRGDDWLKPWNSAYCPKPIAGGLASGMPGDFHTFLYLNGTVYKEGLVALSIGGEVTLKSVIAQGCLPIGEVWTITQTEKNVIHRIGNRPAFEVLVETLNNLPDDMKARAKRNIFAGLVIDEYREEFGRGDFLIRNLIGGDPNEGSIAIGAYPRVGQSMQFQLRDAKAATEDMNEMLLEAKKSLADTVLFGACLCCCNGRGEGLFGEPHHDAGLVQKHLGPLAVGGFFCNGEIGPVGDFTFIHGYTASLAVFVKK